MCVNSSKKVHPKTVKVLRAKFILYNVRARAHCCVCKRTTSEKSLSLTQALTSKVNTENNACEVSEEITEISVKYGNFLVHQDNEESAGIMKFIKNPNALSRSSIRLLNYGDYSSAIDSDDRMKRNSLSTAVL